MTQNKTVWPEERACRKLKRKDCVKKKGLEVFLLSLYIERKHYWNKKNMYVH